MSPSRAQQKEETRERLLAAARERFDQGSVVTTPLDAVAAAAGVSKATLFFHFATRADLLRAVAGSLAKELAPLLDADRAATTLDHVRAFLAIQADPRVRLLWEIGDVLAADGQPQPDVVYTALRRDLTGLGRRAGADEARATAVAGVVAPATFMLGRRVAFGSAEPAEVDLFLAHVHHLTTTDGTP
ncbi:TetR/AcrR family transcriptional regulator [Iamia sp. SCSIO 61187]|uniref:TetR/AcrR family transcriptional regulator n=1 Tax=Iamia sp. SCSIO 61187 TaxID=2722752 RepID=UPI001C624CF6|nr:TetR/AcrR family transcriptional regulator [Iamia sp. SCSIO 61187]QYG94022.1 TetR/AcrR family transcriptional regulator [Iamia sp. SCSIO 61187]